MLECTGTGGPGGICMGIVTSLLFVNKTTPVLHASSRPTDKNHQTQHTFLSRLGVVGGGGVYILDYTDPELRLSHCLSTSETRPPGVTEGM